MHHTQDIPTHKEGEVSFFKEDYAAVTTAGIPMFVLTTKADMDLASIVATVAKLGTQLMSEVVLHGHKGLVFYSLRCIPVSLSSKHVKCSRRGLLVMTFLLSAVG